MANDLNLYTLRNIAKWNVTVNQCLKMHELGHMSLLEATTTAACVLAEENKQLRNQLSDALAKSERTYPYEKEL